MARKRKCQKPATSGVLEIAQRAGESPSHGFLHHKAAMHELGCSHEDFSSLNRFYYSLRFEIMGQAESSADVEVSLQDIQELYCKFASECPSGRLHLHEFKKIFGVSSSSTEEEQAYMENAFRAFDTNKDGKIDFMEFVAAVNLILRGKLEDKLKWSFKVYDRDGNGCLTRLEVRHIVKIIKKIKRHGNPSVTENIDDICDRIFELVDKNRDSQISLEEFIEGAEKDPWVMEQLKLDLGPSDWFVKQMKKTS